MILAGAAVALLASLMLAIFARPIGHRLPPATAVRLLVGAALIIASATAFVLAVVAFTAAGSQDEVAEKGHWSASVVARLAEIPPPVGVVAGVLLTLVVVSTLRRMLKTWRAFWAADVECRHLGEGIDGLVVIDDDSADAYALPGVRGRIVVSRGMLAALSPAERRVLLAHERSHLDHRHSLYVQLANIAVATNPLLRPVATAVRDGVERWADEDAAQAVGDRRLAARALARAALAATQSMRRPSLDAALAATRVNVTARAMALLAPAPRPRRALAAAILGCALVAGAGAVIVEHSAEHTFETADSVSAGVSATK